ncbi:hypothetical protein HDU97_007810 [Phlyctochytrium planicorne]|nr:hypothetical protein HDU97_007810 [Phlyctochytrium planicorne]
MLSPTSILTLLLAAGSTIAAPHLSSRNNNAAGDKKYLKSIKSTTSPLPSANFNDLMTWDQAIDKASKLVDTLTVEEMATIASGIGWATGPCVGNINPVPRIGFKGLCLQDAPTGVRYVQNVSAFPASINVAATFDKHIMYRHGNLLGEEARDKGVNVLLAPVANMLRAPAGGRIWEAQGADPFLTGVSVALQIRGIQDKGVQATLKHFIANEQEHYRDGGESVIDERTLFEIYVRPFKFGVDAGVTSIMCSYNKFTGLYACENPYLMITVLKDALNFRSYVMSDWWASHATVASANAGLDMCMPGNVGWGNPEPLWGPKLSDAVGNGQVEKSRVRDMAVRILAGYFKLGQDKDYPAVTFDSFRGTPVSNNVQRDHKIHIREVGAASSVLVKHVGNALPITSQKAKRIAIVGEDAGDWIKAGVNEAPDHGDVPKGTLAQGWGSGTTNFPYIVSPVKAISEQANLAGVAVSSFTESNYDLGKVADTVQDKDMAVVFVNSNSGEGYITVDNNQGDRNNLTLWLNGNALIDTVASRNKNTVVVIHSPGPVDMTTFHDHPNVTAIIYALFPGQETGNAIADVLLGKVNPSGRLPFSVMRTREEYAADVEYVDRPVIYSEGVWGDYRGDKKRGVEALYPFGHGLSYSLFRYRDLKVSVPAPAAAEDGSYPVRAVVEFRLKNTGPVAGHEVPQLYVTLPGKDQPMLLKGFERVWLEKGEAKVVRFEIDEEDLSSYDVVGKKWVVARGEVKVAVGASSGDLRLHEKVVV